MSQEQAFTLCQVCIFLHLNVSCRGVSMCIFVNAILSKSEKPEESVLRKGEGVDERPLTLVMQDTKIKRTSQSLNAPLYDQITLYLCKK